MSIWGSGFIPIIIYAIGGSVVRENHAILTENSIELLTEANDELLVEA
jgi:hypothetical protein